MAQLPHPSGFTARTTSNLSHAYPQNFTNNPEKGEQAEGLQADEEFTMQSGRQAKRLSPTCSFHQQRPRLCSFPSFWTFARALSPIST